MVIKGEKETNIEMIKLESATKKRLDVLKVIPRETYNGVIKRLIAFVYDKNNLRKFNMKVMRLKEEMGRK